MEVALRARVLTPAAFHRDQNRPGPHLPTLPQRRQREHNRGRRAANHKQEVRHFVTPDANQNYVARPRASSRTLLQGSKIND
jgi:hypothetical protein